MGKKEDEEKELRGEKEPRGVIKEEYERME